MIEMECGGGRDGLHPFDYHTPLPFQRQYPSLPFPTEHNGPYDRVSVFLYLVVLEMVCCMKDYYNCSNCNIS